MITMAGAVIVILALAVILLSAVAIIYAVEEIRGKH